MFLCTGRRLFEFACVLVIFIACASGDYDARGSESLGENGGERTPQEGNECVGNNCVKRTINSSPGAMWFGPRLGRRRRSGHKPEMNSKRIDSFSDSMNMRPWALVSIPDEKRQTHFTPRLGRELAEELIYGEFEDLPLPDQDEREDPYIEVRPRPSIVPRLGRQAPFLPPPRLGRELRQMLARI